MANTKPRRKRPGTKQDRARLCQINTRLNDPETPADIHAELEAERDRLAPVIPFSETGSSLESGSPILDEDSKKPTRADLDAWRDRILDRRAGIPRQRTAKELDKAKAAIQPLLDRDVVNDEVRALAAEHIAFAYSLPNNAFSAEDEAALVQLKIDAWTGCKTADEKSASLICGIYGLTK